MNTVYFDESGNTGPDLLNNDQPVFVLSSVCLAPELCASLLDPVTQATAGEVHFTKLKRQTAMRKRLIDLLSSDSVNDRTTKVYFVHKRFMVTCKYLDLLLEPMLHNDGIDYYDGGMNLSHANLHYMIMPVFCGADATEAFFKDFVAMFRQRTPEAVDRFYATLRATAAASRDKDFASELEILGLSLSHIHTALTQTPDNALNPAIPAFVALASEWNKQFGQSFAIVHDDSKPLSKERAGLEAFLTPWQAPKEIGYGYQRAPFPFNVTSLVFASSHDHKQIQLADIVAGSYGHWLRGQANPEYQDAFWEELNHSIRANNRVIGSITPSTFVGVYEDRKKRPGDVDTLDYLTQLLVRHKKQ